MATCWVCGAPAPLADADSRYVSYACPSCGGYAVSSTVLNLTSADPIAKELRLEMLDRARRDFRPGGSLSVPRILSRDL